MIFNTHQLKSLRRALFALSSLSSVALPLELLANNIRVVTTIPELAWVAKEIGQDKVETESLLTGSEDPHFVDARPDYVSKALKADVACIVGLGLETGWMNRVLAKTGKKSIQPGGQGYCELGKHVSTLDKPSGLVDRSQGDVHPEGNPHFWLSPSALAQASQEISNALARVDKKNEAFFKKNYEKLTIKLTNTRTELLHKLEAAGLVGEAARFFEYHREFSYFANDYGLVSLESLEEKPGVSPSGRRIAAVAQQARQIGVRLVLAGATAPRKILARFEELSGVRVVTLPLHIQPNGVFQDYIQLQTHMVQLLIEAHKGSNSAQRKTSK